MHVVGKHRGTGAAGVGFGEQALKIVPIKNVVAQHQGRRVVADEIRTNGESLRQPVGAGLHRVLDIDAPLALMPHWLPSPNSCIKRGVAGASGEDGAFAVGHISPERQATTW